MVDDNLLTPLQEIQNVVHCALTLAVPNHETEVRLFTHCDVFCSVKLKVAPSSIHFYRTGIPTAEIVSARVAGKEHDHVRVGAIKEKFLDGLVRSVGITDKNEKTFRNHILRSGLDLLV